MDREVKVRIDLVLDNQASLLDSVKQINGQIDKYEEKLKRLKNLQATGNYNYLLEKEVELLRKRNQYQRELQTANTPLANAQRQLDFENRILQTQKQRDNDAINRQVHYQSRFGRLGGVMSVADRMTMGPLGYAAASGAMLGMAGAAGGTAVGTFSGALRRAAGEIGLMFVPAIMSAANLVNSFAGWVRDLNPALKTTIGYLATWGLAVSAGAKVLSIIGNIGVGIKEMFTGTALNIAATNLNIAAGNLTAAAITLRTGAVTGNITSIGGGGAAAMSVGAFVSRWVPPIAAAVSAFFLASDIYGNLKDGEYGKAGAKLLPGGQTATQIWEFGQKRNRDQAPLAIPGFQSQQMDIFSLKDMIQQESLRDPSGQATFELSVREFHTAVNKWVSGMGDADKDREADANMGPVGRTARNILVNLGIL